MLRLSPALYAPAFRVLVLRVEGSEGKPPALSIAFGTEAPTTLWQIVRNRSQIRISQHKTRWGPDDPQSARACQYVGVGRRVHAPISAGCK